jgi:hypothetical protein
MPAGGNAILNRQLAAKNRRYENLAYLGLQTHFARSGQLKQ